MQDQAKAELIAGLVAAAMDPATADGRAGMGAVLRALEAEEPGALQRISAAIRLARLRPGASAAH